MHLVRGAARLCHAGVGRHWGWPSVKLLYFAPLRLLILLPAAQPSLAATLAENGANPIKHVVILFQENHTFDNYFGTFPGANGISYDPSTVHPYHITGSISDLCHSTLCAHA